MAEEVEVDKSAGRSMLLLPLLLSAFLASTVTISTNTLLIEIASTFEVSLGTASQLGLITHIIGLIVGLAMGGLTVRFQEKSLFLCGITIFAVGVLGFFLSQNFMVLLLFQFFVGTGTAIIGIIIYPLIGQIFPPEKRSRAIGLTFSMTALCFIIVGPLSGLIPDVAGWRSVLWFILPLCITCLVLSWFFIPSNYPKLLHAVPSYLGGFRQVFKSKPALFCLMGILFFSIAGVLPVYVISFFRVNYIDSPAIDGMFASIAAVGAVVGGLLSGKLNNRFGSKPLAVIFAPVACISGILLTCSPNLFMSVFFWVIVAFATSIATTALFVLLLKLIPSYKGTTMSVNAVFQNLGFIFGLIMGGSILNSFDNNFIALTIILGITGVISLPFFYLFIDINRNF